MKKKNIPTALRREVWIKHNGKVFNAKCKVSWCNNEISPFNFECGHNIPESKGGKTNLDNLLPICSSCNKSMGNRYTIVDFGSIFGNNRIHPELENTQNTQNTQIPQKIEKPRKLKIRWFSCFSSG